MQVASPSIEVPQVNDVPQELDALCMPSSSCLDPRIGQEFGAKVELIPCILPTLQILHHICTISETSTLAGKVLDAPQMGVKSDPVEGQGGEEGFQVLHRSLIVCIAGSGYHQELCSHDIDCVICMMLEGSAESLAGEKCNNLLATTDGLNVPSKG